MSLKTLSTFFEMLKRLTQYNIWIPIPRNYVCCNLCSVFDVCVCAFPIPLHKVSVCVGVCVHYWDNSVNEQRERECGMGFFLWKWELGID